jgi:hypothetical protein
MTRDLNATTLHQLLSDDHAEMRKLIGEFLQAVQAGNWPSADAIFGKLEPLIDRHITFEEVKVFPVFHEYPDQVPAASLSAMIQQHDAISKALRETGIGLQLHQIREPVMRQLADIIDEHAAEEDAWADAVLAEFNKSGAGSSLMGRLRSLLRESSRG